MSNLERFADVTVGAKFYPTLGEEADFFFVKTGEQSAVRVNRRSLETEYYEDVYEPEHFPHWHETRPHVIPVPETAPVYNYALEGVMRQYKRDNKE